jgi:hypothetical protein
MRKYKLNENFFEKINTEKKAYFLGLLYADGYVNENNMLIEITLYNQDIDILNELIYELYPNNDKPLKLIRNKYYKLVISSKKIVNDLKYHGCVQKKTFKLKFPLTIPDDLIHHFIRGYFDGDGSVYVNKGVLNISLVGTIDFLTSIQNILIMKCGVNNTILDDRHPNRNNNIRALRYGGNIIINRIYHYLYDNATIFLKRKNIKFLDILEKKTYFCDLKYSRIKHQKLYYYDGAKYNKTDLSIKLSKDTKILASTIRRRLYNGWSISEIILTATNQRKNSKYVNKNDMSPC